MLAIICVPGRAPPQSVMEGPLLHIRASTPRKFSHFLFLTFQGWPFALDMDCPIVLASRCTDLCNAALSSLWPTQLLMVITSLAHSLSQLAKSPKRVPAHKQAADNSNYPKKLPHISPLFSQPMCFLPSLFLDSWLCTSYLLCTSSSFGLANLWMSLLGSLVISLLVSFKPSLLLLTPMP